MPVLAHGGTICPMEIMEALPFIGPMVLCACIGLRRCWHRFKSWKGRNEP